MYKRQHANRSCMSCLWNTLVRLVNIPGKLAPHTWHITSRGLDVVCCIACCEARQPSPVRISLSSRSIRRPTLPHVEFDAENVSKTKDVSLSGQRSLPTYVVRRECAEISVLCSDASALRLLVKGTESRSQDGHIREIRQRTPHIARAQGSSSS